MPWCDLQYSLQETSKKKDQKIHIHYPRTRDESQPMTPLFFTALQGHEHVGRNLHFELTKQHKLIHAIFGKKNGLGRIKFICFAVPFVVDMTNYVLPGVYKFLLEII